MKTQEQIFDKISLHERFVGELLDKQQETSNIVILGNLQDNIDKHRMKIELLNWVLSPDVIVVGMGRPAEKAIATLKGRNITAVAVNNNPTLFAATDINEILIDSIPMVISEVPRMSEMPITRKDRRRYNRKKK